MGNELVGLLSRRIRDRVLAEALKLVETPQRFILTAIKDRLDRDGLMVTIPPDLVSQFQVTTTPTAYVIQAVKSAIEIDRLPVEDERPF